MVVVTLGKEAPLNGRLQTVRFQLFQSLQLIEPLDEKQVSDLLDTSSGLEMPPDQKAFQIWSIWLRISLVSITVGFDFLADGLTI